jgi:tripeptidyl-peptidase-1
MKCLRILLLAAAATAAMAARVAVDSVTQFGQWRQRTPASPSTLLELTFAVKLAQPRLLEQELYAVSTPGSVRYGQHLTKAETERLTLPVSENCRSKLGHATAQSTLQADLSAYQVKKWLASHGVTPESVNGRAGAWGTENSAS